MTVIIVKFATVQNVFHVTDPDIPSHIHEVGNYRPVDKSVY